MRTEEYAQSRRTIERYVESIVAGWTRKGLQAGSGQHISALSVEGRDGKQGGNVLPQGVRIIYGQGESARVEWDDGVCENISVPSPDNARRAGWPSRKGIAVQQRCGSTKYNAVTFHVGADEAL